MRSEATERMGMAQLTSRARPKTMLPRMAPARAGIRVTAIAVDLKERKLVVGRGENLDYIVRRHANLGRKLEMAHYRRID
jgi:hypothetical protein